MSRTDNHETCHAGQMFCVSLSGAGLTAAERRMLESVRPGCVLLFARNCQTPHQVRMLTDELRNLLGPDLLIAIDQEGGRVDRLRGFISPMPAATDVAAAGTEAAEKSGMLTARLLRLLGINLNFAPVLDFQRQHDNGLATRTWGNSSHSIIERAAAYLHGLQREGIIGCLKHFPGLGGAELDPHDDLPVVRLEAEALRREDLVPFRSMIESGAAQAVMISHAAYPALERDRSGSRPASLSRAIAHDLLRRDCGFAGLAVTDDLSMGAVSAVAGSVADAVLAAVAAGEDMLLLCGTPAQAEDALARLTETERHDEIIRANLRGSLRRLALLRARLAAPAGFDAGRLEALSLEIAGFRQSLGAAGGQTP